MIVRAILLRDGEGDTGRGIQSQRLGRDGERVGGDGGREEGDDGNELHFE